jgi:signal transduction histidine kinase
MTAEPRPARILIVDDSVEGLGMLRRQLAGSGYVVDAELSGAAALVTAAARPPELAILDLDMPGMDGAELCRRLKEAPGGADLPVIFLSAHDRTADKLSGFTAGAVDYVSKPYSFVELRARIEVQLELGRLRSRLEERGRELAESLERLRAVERARQEFVHMVAHDMRSPIMAVGGYLDLLGEGRLDAATRSEFVARAVEGTRNLSRLVDAMLDLARLEAQRMPVAIGAHDLSRLIERAVTTLGPFSAARIEVDLPPALPPLACDAELMSRVIANLLSNALKHSDEPDKVALRALAADGAVRILVEDRGPGVAEALRPQLFEQFAADARSGARGKSSGLGLAFCRSAVEVQGGEIGYLAPEGSSGARFWLKLPVADRAG